MCGSPPPPPRRPVTSPPLLQLPSVELRNVGPSIDLVLRRTRLASIDNFKRACVIPRSIANVVKHQKNVSRGAPPPPVVLWERGGAS